MKTFKWCKPARTSAGTAAASVGERLRVEQKWMPGPAEVASPWAGTSVLWWWDSPEHTSTHRANTTR